jgi:hypothetical protein
MLQRCAGQHGITKIFCEPGSHLSCSATWLSLAGTRIIAVRQRGMPMSKLLRSGRTPILPVRRTPA